MVYLDINDACRAFERFALKILNSHVKKEGNSIAHVVNVCYPEPITILELARIVQRAIVRHTLGAVNPKIEIVDTNQESLFAEDDKERTMIDLSKTKNFLGSVDQQIFMKELHNSIRRAMSTDIQKYIEKVKST